jgi:serine/alanine adding enzyme
MTGSFAVIGIDDARWEETTTPTEADVFYHPDFCRFRYGGSRDRPVMFRYEDDLGIVFDVTVVRQIAELPFFAEVGSHFGSSPVDLVSPEYNGPMVVGSFKDQSELLRRYRDAVGEYCRDHGVVTEFVRVHPLSECVQELNGVEALVTASEIVYVDLKAGYEVAANGYRRGHRRTIKRAAKEGAHIEIVAPTPQRIERLAAAYAETMLRRGAGTYYSHDLAYFESLFQNLGNRALLVEAYAGNGGLAAVNVFFVGSRYVWDMYLGTVESQRRTGANHFKYDRMICWAAENGYQRLMMGGGFAPGDDLYLYKLGYSSLTAPVRHLRKVHNSGILERLLKMKSEFDLRLGQPTRSNYFPSYRSE